MSDDTSKKPLSERLSEVLKRHPKAIAIGWSLVFVIFLATIPAAVLAWYFLPVVWWEWARPSLWLRILVVVGVFFAAWIPLIVGVWGASLGGFMADVTLAIDEAAIRKAQEAVRETERDALVRLENKDEAGLLPLLKYSRAQLEAYYTTGLEQARRSYVNSAVAMWLGFFVLLAGMALYIAPVDKLGLNRPAEDFFTLIIGTGLIIEFISVLFLWVYRSSLRQLTNFYNRQMGAHTAILSFRMTSKMSAEAASDTIKTIVAKMLDVSSMHDIERPAGARGLGKFIGLQKSPQSVIEK